MNKYKLMNRSTVVDELVAYDLENNIMDHEEIIRNGWVGYAQMDSDQLIIIYNDFIGNDIEDPISMIVDNIENMLALGEDDVYTMKCMVGENGEPVLAGTKCTIMDIEPMDEVGEPIVIQVDDTGVEIRCYRDHVIECTEVE